MSRPLRITSIGVKSGTPETRALELLEQEARAGADLIVLPEVWISQKQNEPVDLDTPVVRTVREIARRYRTSVVWPLDRRDGRRRLNSALFVDSRGEIRADYDKTYPYWDELRLERPVDPGSTITVVDTDFGRVGMAICFDVNFPEVWQRMADRGTELVVWISAYSAGSSLAAHALNHHYYIVTSTQYPDCSVFDITGEEVHHQEDARANISRVTVDLDRCVFHEDFNDVKVKRLLAEHPDEVEMEKLLRREKWFVLRAKKPGVSARELAAEYGLEELRAYKTRSRVQIDELRGRGLES